MIDPNEVIASTKNQLRELIPEGTQLWPEPEYMVEFGSSAETIVRIAAAQRVDMIVIGAKRPAAFTKHLGGCSVQGCLRSALPGAFGRSPILRPSFWIIMKLRFYLFDRSSVYLLASRATSTDGC